MAVKTITIDLEAYELLYQQKQKGESFSKVIKRKLKPEKTATNLLSNLDSFNLLPDTIEKVEEVIKKRKKSVVNSPVIDI